MILDKILLGIKVVGLPNALRAVPYAWMRDQAERGTKKKTSNVGRSPGNLVSVNRETSGARFHFANSDLQIQFLAPDLVQVEWEPGRPVVPYARAKIDWPSIAVRIKDADDEWEISSSELRLIIRADASLRYESKEGIVLREESAPEIQGEAWQHRAILKPEEQLYGLGERAAHLNMRGGTYRMWNSDKGGVYEPGADPLYIGVPVYQSLQARGSYMIFYENSFDARFDFSSPEYATMRFEGGPLRYYFIPGPPPRALERYSELTGRPALPPRWALGYHHSHINYRDEQSVRELADGFRKHDLPLGAIHLDLLYMRGYRDFEIDKTRFPDLARLSRELLEQNVRLVSIIDAGVKQDDAYDVYSEGSAQGVFCKLTDASLVRAPVWPGWAVFPDFTNPMTREWWKGYYPRLLDAGIAGFWHDMNEPAAFAAWGDLTLPSTTQHSLEGRGGDHREAHNVFGLQMNRAGFEALRKHRPEGRPFLLTRSGWAGLQRYAWTWTGDTASTWDILKQTITTCLGLSLSGIPYTGPDVGGSTGFTSSELYLRWFQLAAFLPFFRTYEIWVTKHREPWEFGEPYATILHDTLHLRYALMPYWYTLAWEANQTGHPLIRPLYWDDSTDQDLWNVDDEFLLGANLLVAPVTEEHSKMRRVVLPKSKWYSYWDDAVIEGPSVANIETPLERIGLYVRAGTVLPMEDNGKLVLHIYAGDGVSQLYTDAGDGYGDSRLDKFSLNQSNDQLILNWQSEGGYPPSDHPIRLVLHGYRAKRVWRDGSEFSVRDNQIETEPFEQIRFEE